MTRIGFDNEEYLRQQSEAILERVEKFDNKLYLEFGGKIIFDYHAARVLPGFDPNVKIRLLQKLKDQAEIILCIYAGDIERRKVRADFGITYDVDALKLIDDLREREIEVRAVVITRFDDQPAATLFKNKLERRGVTVYTHRATRGYPLDVALIVSDEGYGANPYIETTKPLVVVSGPGPGSGKLGTCLSQLYHESKRGVQAGYAKFETFPIWSIPLKHPVNIAYESATADLKDYNEVDPFHLEAYGETAINYNRDVEAFPLLKRILDRIMENGSVYQSPTDMGVNRAGFGIVDDEAVKNAARQEIIRRYLRHRCEYAMGLVDKSIVQRAESIMKEIGLSPEDRPVVVPAREAAAEAEERGKVSSGIYCGAAIELDDGSIVTGKNSDLMHAASSLILNAVKQLAGLPDSIHLLPLNIIESVTTMKQDMLKMKNANLDLDETLIALSISATSNPTAQAAMEKLADLQRCEMHMSHMPTAGDEAGLRRLGVNLTTDPNFASKSLFLA
ncbi:DUF1846 domain-containing protein [Planctomycetota bacterium]